MMVRELTWLLLFSIYIIHWMCILPTKNQLKPQTPSPLLHDLPFYFSSFKKYYLYTCLPTYLTTLLSCCSSSWLSSSSPLSSQLSSAFSLLNNQPTQLNSFLLPFLFLPSFYSNHLVFLSSLSSTNHHDCHKREGKLIW